MLTIKEATGLANKALVRRYFQTGEKQGIDNVDVEFEEHGTYIVFKTLGGECLRYRISIDEIMGRQAQA